MNSFKIVLDPDYKTERNVDFIRRNFKETYDRPKEIQKDVQEAYEKAGSILLTAIRINEFDEDGYLVKTMTTTEFKEAYLK